MAEVRMEALILVPELRAHSPSRPKPYTRVPGTKRSGFKIPMPSSRFQVDIPLDEKEAILDRD